MSILGGCEEKNKTPILEERICPNCGDEVEVFTVKGNWSMILPVVADTFSKRKSRLFRRLGAKRCNVRKSRGRLVKSVPDSYYSTRS